MSLPSFALIIIIIIVIIHLFLIIIILLLLMPSLHPTMSPPPPHASAPLYPSVPPPLTSTTRFCRLRADEAESFANSLQPLHAWASMYLRAEISKFSFKEHVNILVEQIALAFHTITRPSVQHQEMKIEREFKSVLSNLPSNPG